MPILPRAKQQQRVAFADFSAAPWQGFEKSERCPNNSSLFLPQAAVVVVAQGWLLAVVEFMSGDRATAIVRKSSKHLDLLRTFAQDCHEGAMIITY